MATKIHVGNLPYETSADAILQLFGRWGDVTDVLIVTGRHDGRPLGFASVTMKNEEDGARAVQNLNGTVFGERPLHVEALEPVDADGVVSTRSRLGRVLSRARGLVRFARDSIGATAASLFLADEDKGELRGAVGELRGTRVSPAPSGAWPAVADALESREIRWISPSQVTGAETSWFEPGRVASTLCVPLVDEEKSIGVLFFDFGPTSRPLREPDLALISDVGARCARALGREARAAVDVTA